jgi:hypothetical protein
MFMCHHEEHGRPPNQQRAQHIKRAPAGMAYVFRLANPGDDRKQQRDHEVGQDSPAGNDLSVHLISNVPAASILNCSGGSQLVLAFASRVWHKQSQPCFRQWLW